ncbi:MAG: LytTR family DNA-binding domain-containing protein [Thermoanaerobaculia bacterium]
MTPTLRTVLVEDEPMARRRLEEILAEVPWVERVGSAADGVSAIELIERARPDLVLLDVQLPELDGVSLLRRLRHRPEVVFTTAHDAYAVAAFELGALDYLVKPFGRERLLAALERVRARAAAREAGPGAVERALEAATSPLTRLFARKGQRIVPIAAREITRIRANGEYAEVHTADGSYLLQVTLKELLERLDPQLFEPVHRSHIVNLEAVEHLRPADDRRLLVTMRDGTRIVASRAASARIRRRVR